MLGVAAKLAVKTKISYRGSNLVAGVKGPHAGEALADGAEVILHRSRPDRFVAAVAGEDTDADAVGKDLEDLNLVGDVNE